MVLESTDALETNPLTMLIYCLALARGAQDAYGALKSKRHGWLFRFSLSA
jgi:hypothetical protein